MAAEVALEPPEPAGVAIVLAQAFLLVGGLLGIGRRAHLVAARVNRLRGTPFMLRVPHLNTTELLSTADARGRSRNGPRTAINSAGSTRVHRKSCPWHCC